MYDFVLGIIHNNYMYLDESEFTKSLYRARLRDSTYVGSVKWAINGLFYKENKCTIFVTFSIRNFSRVIMFRIIQIHAVSHKQSVEYGWIVQRQVRNGTEVLFCKFCMKDVHQPSRKPDVVCYANYL